MCYFNKNEVNLDLPSGPVVKNLPANAGNTGWIPGLGRFHMLLSNSSQYAFAPRAPALQKQKPPQWETHELQLEKAHAQQWSPSTAKNKQIILKMKTKNLTTFQTLTSVQTLNKQKMKSVLLPLLFSTWAWIPNL